MCVACHLIVLLYTYVQLACISTIVVQSALKSMPRGT